MVDNMRWTISSCISKTHKAHSLDFVIIFYYLFVFHTVSTANDCSLPPSLNFFFVWFLLENDGSDVIAVATWNGMQHKKLK